MIDMTYFTPYNAEIGFRFGVEAIYNNNNVNTIYSIVASICPMASFYEPSR